MFIILRYYPGEKAFTYEHLSNYTKTIKCHPILTKIYKISNSDLNISKSNYANDYFTLCNADLKMYNVQ